jgi:HEAT repeat-containing protein 5
MDQNHAVRFVAADTIGRLCGSLQDSLVAKQIKFLTDLVVSNRDPNSRAGCALALGSILFYVGGMAAGLHLRTVLGLLLSLASDPHPTVHFWALEAMEKTINSSGLGFSSHVSSCLGAISKLILSDLFDPDDVTPAMSNIALELPTLASLVRCVDAIVNVLGPDLASTKKSRNLISMLIREMEKNSDPMVANEAIRCTQHLSLFAPEAIDVKLFVRQLETNLESGVPEIRQIACEAIYGLIRKDVQAVFSNARPSFSDELWALLNNHSEKSDGEEIISSWVEQTALTDVKRWISICLRFLTHAGQQDTLPKTDSKGETNGDPSEFIDEAAAFSAQDTNRAATDDGSVPYLRWQAISFALTCLRRVVETNFKGLNVESDCSAHPLVVNVGDLVRVAFTACTSTVVDIRLGGLKLFHDLIKVTNHYCSAYSRGWRR